MAAILESWKRRARQLKTEVYALFLAYKHPRTPWYARIFTAVVVAYAFSPIDLIPDFIPVLGYLDDLVLVPLGVILAIRMVPKDVMEQSRLQARVEMTQGKRVSNLAALVIVLMWIGLAILVGWLVYQALK